MAMRINGELVTLTPVGTRWEARVGDFALLTICERTDLAVMTLVVLVMDQPACRAVAA